MTSRPLALQATGPWRRGAVLRVMVRLTQREPCTPEPRKTLARTCSEEAESASPCHRTGFGGEGRDGRYFSA